MRASKSTRKIALIMALFVGYFVDHAIGQSGRPVDGPAPQDSYELRFLGCKQTVNEYSNSHDGIFLFIWEGQKATQILAYPSRDPREIVPFPDFGIHYKTGWQWRGGWCGTGAYWINVQPGQVFTFVMDMGWVEKEIAPFPSPKDADKARLQISSMDGEIISDEFPLPLFPGLEK